MSSGLVIPAGVYASHSESIAKEIQIAKDYGKKIVAVIPYGQERASKIATDNADETVKWNASSIVKAIKDNF